MTKPRKAAARRTMPAPPPLYTTNFGQALEAWLGREDTPNPSQLARVLGCSRQTLYSWMAGEPVRRDGSAARAYSALCRGKLPTLIREEISRASARLAELEKIF